MGTNITGIGNANAIGFKSRVTGGAYFPPELKDALVGVWSAYGKSNDSTDRNIIKNKIKDRGGDFVISNAAFKLNSGFGGFVEDFTSWDRIDSSTAEISNDGSKIKCINTTLNVQYLFNSINRDIPSFKVKISNFTKGDITYYYRKEDGIEAFLKINPLSVVNSDKVIELPKSYNTVENGTGGRGGFYSSNINIGVTITQIPSFEGAFVTDGIDDLITSTKTVQEMLGGSNEITVVSMIHQIGFISSRNYARNNYFIQGNDFLTNTISAIGKIGIYGYKGNLSNIAIVNDILGDKKDYSVDKANPANIDSVFSVNGTHSSAQLSQVAWYWTFIAKRVLTEDEINLVIEKYNLDRPGEIVKPDVYYDIKRQKITNDNHSAFDDKLIDYSGNGYDAKLYNFGWKEDSGIGKYETDFTDWKKSFKVTSFDSESIKFTSDVSWVLLYHPSSIGEDIPSFKVRIKLYGKGTLHYNYITQEGKYTNVAVKSEIFETPICYNTKYTGEKGVNVGFTLGVTSGECSGTITQIPEYENALVLDGVDDYGKVTGLPILKDYTVAADYIRTFAKENAQDSPILSKSKVADSGAFLFNYLNADSITSSYSFGTNNILKEINDSERKIYYLSKYASDGHNVNAGSAVDYDTMWLGTYRDNTSNFFTGALYFAMLFPYSLSEFLLERQIKKARAGTLYPNQVEFRPIIPEDENITKIDYFVVNSGTWTIIKPGDYVDVGARIVFNIYTKLPYKVAGVSSTSFTGMSIRPSTGLNIFDVQGYIKDKTPQKIKLTLAVNEDIIQWNPTISANIPDSYDAVTEWFANGWETKIAVGDWIKKSDRIFFKLKLKEPLHEIGKVTFGGSECQATKASNWSESNNLWEIVTYSSVGDLSQVFNVQVDEYIRYEDIVQPYPILLRFNDENGNGVSWGGKFRVGSTITRIGSIADPESNLLNGLYSISGLSLNGKAVTSSTSIVEKQMVFKTTATWLLDNSKPKCILSPSRLRIPNSSYKLLGYIPDISGHGNHGKINNSAYAGMSGVNGYPVVFGANKTWANESNGYVTSITNNTIHITNVLNAGLALLYSYVKYNGNLQNIKEIPPFKIEIKGLEGRSKFIYKYLATSDATKETNLYLGNGTHELPKSFLPTEALINNAVVGFSISPIEEGVTNFLSDITIKVLPEYEGAYCLDGVDDFVTIPTTVGGKQVLMKVNWDSPNASILYDQRGYNNEFAIYNGTNDSDGNPIPAYQGRNNGQTYIDGILNSNIKASELRAITHNITITNELSSGTNKTYPIIGSSKSNAYFVNMALYDFMLFDEISTDDKIKELNEYIGLSGNIFEFNPPTFTIDLPMAIKNIKVYQGGNEISPGYLYPNKDTEFEVYVSLNDGKYAVDTITVDGVEIAKDRVVGEYNIFKFTLNGSSEQKITIHSYEYIMYEDITQPYPTIFELKDTSINKIYTYGDKLKVGSEFLFNRYINLLPEMYKPVGAGLYNGNEFKSGNTYIVSSTMVFSWTLPVSYLLEGSAPKCIFSPSKLRIPNSSYKYLGYIPDISGNGNNGTFTNFAFSGMSGADGYLFDFYTVISLVRKVLVTDDTIVVSRDSTSDQTWVLNLLKQSRQFDLYVNWEDNSTRLLIWSKSGTIISQYALSKGWNSIPAVSEDYDYIYLSYVSPSVLGQTVIKQKAKYEGSICFDGIDDFIKIDTTGGMTMLMKANVMSTTDRILYDQRDKNSEGNLYKEFAILTSSSDSTLAYAGRHTGTTYIDGILNTNITCGQLLNITHNITAVTKSNLVGTEQGVRIGASAVPASYCKAAVFDFMLFDTKCTDDVIKQLNDIIGIKGDYVQKPSYYWDAYGKSNLDADRGFMKDQISLQLNNDNTNDNSLENFNFAYDKMSGYGGYSFKSFNDSADAWNIRGDGTGVEIISRDGYSMTIKKLVQNLDWNISNNEYRYPAVLSKELPFRCKSNKNVGLIWQLKYKTEGATSDTTVTLLNQQLTPNVPLEVSLPYKTQEELTELGAVSTSVYYLLYFSNTTLAIGEEYTVEMLPLYPNGLVYDGVDDYSENINIPTLSDFTLIVKALPINESEKDGGAIIRKGASNKVTGGGYAFIYALDSSSSGEDKSSYWSFGKSLLTSSPPLIGYMTKTNVNGVTTTSGANPDERGICVAKWTNYKSMIFYKSMLYPRTTDMLTINMIKNMMAEDGIIDIQGKLFTDKFTGDFNLDFNKDFLIGN